MKIIEILKKKQPTLSFEVFPPKTTDSYESVVQAVENIASLSPDYMSVTYGAGGGTSEFTAKIAKIILDAGVTPLAHLTCVSSSKQKVLEQIKTLQEEGVENIMALRGDIPPVLINNDRSNWEYHYASELIAEIKKQGDFCVGGACYPECHVESVHQEQDLLRLKNKVETGCDFLTTQMFFDNNLFYNFLYKLRELGVTVPVVAGIMPVTNAKNIKRSCALSNATLPQRFRAIVDRFGENPKAMKQAGIAYATDQIIDLYANGIEHVHVYTMNKPDVAKAIQDNLSYILGR